MDIFSRFLQTILSITFFYSVSFFIFYLLYCGKKKYTQFEHKRKSKTTNYMDFID